VTHVAARAGNIVRYDTIYGLWYANLPPMPVPYTRFAFAAGADTVYVVGGIGGDEKICLETRSAF
jgi:hypothetical protein